MADTKGISQPLTVHWACAISPEHFEGARLELFLCKVLQENTSYIIEAGKGREYSAGQEKNGRAVYYVFYEGLRRTMR